MMLTLTNLLLAPTIYFTHIPLFIHIIHYSLSLHPAVRIGFESENYMTSEAAGSVMVCVVVDSTLEREATASIAAVGGTAEGKERYTATLLTD